MYNLLYERWIPVRRRSGAREWIEPWRLTENPDDPITAVDSCRFDFNGALTEFLIGLVQSAMPPQDDRGWRRRLKDPPKEDELRAAFAPLKDVFLMDGDGPRFMQDLTLSPVEAGETRGPASLLLEAPGDKTMDENRDLFIKRGRIDTICQACAATALYALQSYAPSGGQGHRVSLRGGGPLTTVVVGDTLWETIWSNVLEERYFSSLFGPHDERTYPWLGKTRTSENGKKTTPRDMHPLHVFWGMPRRIRLVYSGAGECDLCGRRSEQTVRKYLAKNHGFNYGESSWKHPLTAYRLYGKNWISYKGQSGGIGYRHWLGLVHGEPEKSEPARAVQVFRENRCHGRNFRLWAFGYDTDNMKVLGWCEGTIPVLHVTDDCREVFADFVGRLVDTANWVCESLCLAIKTAWRGEEKPSGGVVQNGTLSGSTRAAVEARFWQETEPVFYDTVNQGREDLTPDGLVKIKCSWMECLGRVARRIFEDLSQTGEFTALSPARIAVAWNQLRRATSTNNNLLRRKLDMPGRKRS